jgi:hypothetical protein
MPYQLIQPLDLAKALKAFRRSDGASLSADQYETLIMLIFNAMDANAMALPFDRWESACQEQL